MIPPLINKVSRDKLINLFLKRSEHLFILPRSAGKGYMRFFDLEKGLQASFWNCCFKEGIEIYNDVDFKSENVCFTLAFFTNMQGLRFANKNMFFKENKILDTAFISATCEYRIYIAPGANGQWLSISFSKKWFEKNVVANNDELKHLKRKMNITEPLLLLESMNPAENKLIKELFDVSGRKPFGSFYIKSSVLTIISDFFYKIKGRKNFSLNDSCFDSITKVEEYLSNHLTNTLPNLKDVAHKFSISESTLKRHFKKKYGLNMSAYFIKKKMEQADHLIRGKKMSNTETASFLGYRNVNHFIAAFKKYQESLTE